MKSGTTIVIFFGLCFTQVAAWSQQKKKVLLHTDFITTEGNIPKQDFYIQSDSSYMLNISVTCYKLHAAHTDSVLIDKSILLNQKVSQGLNTLSIDYSNKKNGGYIEPTFYKVLHDLNIVIPGNYVMYADIIIGHDTMHTKTVREYDSTLSMSSHLRKDINRMIEKSSFLTKKQIKANTKSEDLESHFDNKVATIVGKKGVSNRVTRNGAREVNDFYYDTCFIGRYTLEIGKNLQAQVAAEKEKITNDASSLVKNGLENYESVFSQLKKLNEKNKKEQELRGEFGMAANMSNQQQSFSSQDRNFYEFNGNLEAPLLGIPVQIEGYYTTQDIHRRAKASYIRFHYDADKAKSELMGLISGYNTQYEQASSKGKGLDGVYSSYLKNLGSQKKSMILDLAKQTGMKELSKSGNGVNSYGLDKNNLDTAALLQAMISKIDTSGGLNKDQEKLQKKKDSVYQVYHKAMKKYQEIKVLEEKMEKYYTLLEQYKNTSHFDSLLAYDKVKNVKSYEKMSYKDMAKMASGLLPDGKAKQVVTGLTNFDIGMFPKYTSKYTMGGQMLKGADVGYDIGFATTHATVGKTEYVGRDGSVDKYTCYSGSVQFKPVYKQQMQLIYYGYSPSKRMFSEDKEFFIKMDASYPSFKNPVHIISVAYTGGIGKVIQTNAEIATSIKRGDSTSGFILSNDKLAYAFGIEGDIPKTNISSSVEYEHTGIHFENNTIPFSLSGTNRIKIAAKSTFFRSFLQIGIEYNYLIQHNMTNDSRNTRWGFDIKTQSKQYPTLSLSYKPFSTFRSYTDTLGIPQRPLFGEVWIGKASYQFKKDKRVYRFMFLCNKNTSTMDTAQYSNDLLQLSFFYTNKKFTASVSLANMKMKSSVPETLPAWHANTSYITSVNGTYVFDKPIAVNGGIDVGVSKFGISNTGINGGLSYKTKKIPMTYRMSIRYNRYKVEEMNQWQNRIAAVMAVIWRFSYKKGE